MQIQHLQISSTETNCAKLLQTTNLLPQIQEKKHYNALYHTRKFKKRNFECILEKSDVLECNLRLESVWFAPSNSVLGCTDVSEKNVVWNKMHISNAISSFLNAKKGISKLCWLKIPGPQLEERVSGNFKCRIWIVNVSFAFFTYIA